jgi:hypothetical protein
VRDRPVDDQTTLPELAQHTVALLDSHATLTEKQALVHWARGLLAIRDWEVDALTKAQHAIEHTAESRVALILLSAVGRPLKQVAWDDRTWAVRLGLGVAIGAAATTSQGAGIAALGTAVGVPLWVVLGAGASFAGVLLDELEASIERGKVDTRPSERGTSLEHIPEAEWVFVDQELAELKGDSANALLAMACGSDESAPRWKAAARTLGRVVSTPIYAVGGGIRRRADASRLRHGKGRRS